MRARRRLHRTNARRTRPPPANRLTAVASAARLLQRASSRDVPVPTFAVPTIDHYLAGEIVPKPHRYAASRDPFWILRSGYPDSRRQADARSARVHASRRRSPVLDREAFAARRPSRAMRPAASARPCSVPAGQHLHPLCILATPQARRRSRVRLDRALRPHFHTASATPADCVRHPPLRVDEPHRRAACRPGRLRCRRSPSRFHPRCAPPAYPACRARWSKRRARPGCRCRISPRRVGHRFAGTAAPIHRTQCLHAPAAAANCLAVVRYTAQAMTAAVPVHLPLHDGRARRLCPPLCAAAFRALPHRLGLNSSARPVTRVGQPCPRSPARPACDELPHRIAHRACCFEKPVPQHESRTFAILIDTQAVDRVSRRRPRLTMPRLSNGAEHSTWHHAPVSGHIVPAITAALLTAMW
jgi:hypothetical protein